MRKRQPAADNDLLKAWQIYSRFRGAAPNRMPLEERDFIIKTYYPDLKPRSGVQHYCIAERLLKNATALIERLSPIERAALRTLNELYSVKSPSERQGLSERFCIQAEELGEDSPVIMVSERYFWDEAA